MKPRAQRIFALLASAFILAACNRHNSASTPSADARIQQKIVGSWGMEISNVEGMLTLQPNGSFSGYWSNTVRPKGWRSEGEWKIAEGAIVSKITSKTAWNFTLSGPTGAVDSVKILSLTDDELVTEVDGQTNKWTRKK
jgi:hypothetical protein